MGVRVYLEVLDEGMPPPMEFDTLGNWLHAMPEATNILLISPETEETPYQQRLARVGEVLDAMAMSTALNMPFGWDDQT